MPKLFQSPDSVFTCDGNCVKITREIAAQHHIEMALFLFFHEGEAIAIHTLIAASYDMLKDIYSEKSREDDSLTKTFKTLFPDEKEFKKAINSFRAPQNFFKHADGNADEELYYDLNHINMLIVHCINMFDKVFGYINNTMSTFNAWYIINSGETIRTDESGMLTIEKIKKRFSKLRKREFLIHVGLLYKDINNENQLRITFA